MSSNIFCSASCRTTLRRALQHPFQHGFHAASTSTMHSFSTAQSHNDHGSYKTKSPPIENPFSVKHFSYQDPLNFTSLLAEEEIAIQTSVHNFCQSELQPQILMANRHEDTLGHEQMRRMGEMGMLGSTIPERYGGAGLGYVSYGLIATEVERVDSSYRSAMSEFIIACSNTYAKILHAPIDRLIPFIGCDKK